MSAQTVQHQAQTRAKGRAEEEKALAPSDSANNGVTSVKHTNASCGSVGKAQTRNVTPAFRSRNANAFINL